MRCVEGYVECTQDLNQWVLRIGYYWPKIRKDCVEYVKKCEECQKFGNISHLPAEEFHSIVAPWPFAIWGVDILEPFPLSKEQVKCLLVGIDHFTKWIKVDTITTISAASVQKFIWKSIIDSEFTTSWSLTTEHVSLKKCYTIGKCTNVIAGYKFYKRDHLYRDLSYLIPPDKSKQFNSYIQQIQSKYHGFNE